MGLITFVPQPKKTRRPLPPFARVGPGKYINLDGQTMAMCGLSWKRCLLSYDTEAKALRIKLLRDGDDESRAIKLGQYNRNPNLESRRICATGYQEQLGLVKLLDRSARYPTSYDESRRIISIDLTEPIGVRK